MVCRVFHYLKCTFLTEPSSRCYPTRNKSCFSRLREAAGVSPAVISRVPPDSGEPALGHAPGPTLALPLPLPAGLGRGGHMGRPGACASACQRRDGPGPPGRPRRPLKSVPIYISPAPAGGGAGEIRLPFPSRAERGERAGADLQPRKCGITSPPPPAMGAPGQTTSPQTHPATRGGQGYIQQLLFQRREKYNWKRSPSPASPLSPAELGGRGGEIPLSARRRTSVSPGARRPWPGRAVPPGGPTRAVTTKTRPQRAPKPAPTPGTALATGSLT